MPKRVEIDDELHDLAQAHCPKYLSVTGFINLIIDQGLTGVSKVSAYHVGAGNRNIVFDKPPLQFPPDLEVTNSEPPTEAVKAVPSNTLETSRTREVGNRKKFALKEPRVATALRRSGRPTRASQVTKKLKVSPKQRHWMYGLNSSLMRSRLKSFRPPLRDLLTLPSKLMFMVNTSPVSLIVIGGFVMIRTALGWNKTSPMTTTNLLIPSCETF